MAKKGVTEERYGHNMKITVLGGGNGAFATAAHMSFLGHEVTLSNRNFSKISYLKSNSFIEISGGALPDCTVQIARIMENPAEAIIGADIICICVPTMGHEYYANIIARSLCPEQIILLNPGHVGGALQFSYALRQSGYKHPLNIFESHTLMYATRKEGDHRIGIYNVCSNIMVASLPAQNPNFSIITQLYPSVRYVPNILYTTLSDHNAVMHPPGMLLNAALIQRTNGDFTFYDEGMSPAVGELIQELDNERLSIADALGIKIDSFMEAFYKAGYTTKEAYESGCVYSAIKNSTPNKKIRCEPSLKSRYIQEDVGFGLVPMCEIAKRIGVSTPVMDAFITLCGKINNTDYRKSGLTLEKLGLNDITSAKSLLDKIKNFK